MFLKSYRLKITPAPKLAAAIQYFADMVQAATQHLLVTLWTESWLDRVAFSALKAYKVIGEAQVGGNLGAHSPIYLPSRIRRGIAERVGQVLRSQFKRKECFYDCLRVVEVIGLEGNLNTLVRRVAKTLQVFYGRFYRYALIRQTLRLLRRLHLKHRIDVWLLRYTDVVRPVLKTFVFPYSPDDGQALQYTCDGKTLVYQMKLPVVHRPTNRRHWQWFHGHIPIPERLQDKLTRAKAPHPRKPLLKTHVLKGGLVVPILQFPWAFNSPPMLATRSTKAKNSLRMLCVDLGLINLATSVACEAGWQVSPPIFIKLNSERYRAIERLYKHITGVERKLKRNPPTWTGQGRRKEERSKLYRKLNRYRAELAHAVSNTLVNLARDTKCSMIVLEDLRSIEPIRGKFQLSRRLSNWLRGQILKLIEYKCQEAGLRLVTVNPWGTSSYCPRCGTKGKKIKAPNNFIEAAKEGRYFHCTQCGFTADRDYVGALNLYRVLRLNKIKQETLRTASPLLYQRRGTPANRPVGGSVLRGEQEVCLVA